jgi:hypothetical protein
MRFIGLVFPVAVVMLSTQLLFAQAPQPLKPTAPGASGDPAWQGTVHLSDGRTFVTDGGLALDASVAKGVKLPDRQLPGKRLEDFLKAPQTAVCGLADVTKRPFGKTYQTPNGIALNATYIDYLRRTLTVRSVRLHMTAPAQPVLVEANGKLVGVLMPVAQ